MCVSGVCISAHELKKATCSLRPSTMDIEVKLISRKTIKPSSPTPHHLRKFPLSIIDQLHPPSYTRMILFYAAPGGSSGSDDANATSSILSKLKCAISQTLAHFYPLAGSHEDSLQIVCDDRGLSFVESRVTNCDLSALLERLDLRRMFNHLFPSHNNASDPACERETFQVLSAHLNQLCSHPLQNIIVGIFFDELNHCQI